MSRPSRHRDAVIERAGRSPLRAVMPVDWREGRALRRMAARGEAVPFAGFPNVWIVLRHDPQRAAHLLGKCGLACPFRHDPPPPRPLRISDVGSGT
jgi:hypothetical protein